jgi:putative ABC transport system permease protein
MPRSTSSASVARELFSHEPLVAGFAYRIHLSCWMFVAAGTVAVSIAWLTVSAHAFAVARARPVAALRYE